MKRRIVVDASKCCGCRVCEMICSLKHAGIIEPGLSAIHRISCLPHLEFNLKTCLQCPAAPCARVCPVDAIRWNHEIGVLAVDATLCTLCRACVEACPVNSIVVLETQAFKCDLCEGDPLCVVWCPRSACSISEHLKNDANIDI
ncbi:MAG: 4Fe-4S dicluster domain-containing protein [Anaerolineales bacterium]|nr:4Fe-4S dicluster domain-containing protein [Anaerolineales bacterium]